MPIFAIKFFLKREIKRLNRIIDKKIEKGVSYRKESRVHKALMDKVNNIKPGMTLSKILL